MTAQYSGLADFVAEFPCTYAGACGVHKQPKPIRCLLADDCSSNVVSRMARVSMTYVVHDERAVTAVHCLYCQACTGK